MANQPTPVTLDEATDGIVAALAAHLGESVATVVAYPDDPDEQEDEERARLPMPAVTVELAEWEPTPDANTSTGQTILTLRWRVRAIVDKIQPRARRRVRDLGLRITHFCRDNRFGLPIHPAEIISGAPDDYTPGLDDLEVWAVDFTTVARFGSMTLDPEVPVPPEVYLGLAPDIGPPHVEDYDRIFPEEP